MHLDKVRMESGHWRTNSSHFGTWIRINGQESTLSKFLRNSKSKDWIDDGKVRFASKEVLWNIWTISCTFLFSLQFVSWKYDWWNLNLNSFEAACSYLDFSSFKINFVIFKAVELIWFLIYSSLTEASEFVPDIVCLFLPLRKIHELGNLGCDPWGYGLHNFFFFKQNFPYGKGLKRIRSKK